MIDPFEKDGGGGGLPLVWVLVAVAVLLVATVVFMLGWNTASGGVTALPTPEPTATPTPRTVRAEAVINGVRLWDDDEVGWLSYYDQNSQLLGQPLAGPGRVDGYDDCITFDFYVICHVPGISGDWSYLPLALGYGALPVGIDPQLDVPAAPPAQAFIDGVRADGRDPVYWVGRTISPAMCSAQGCVQVFERAVLQWPNRPGAGAQDVTRSLLGRQRAEQSEATNEPAAGG